MDTSLTSLLALLPLSMSLSLSLLLLLLSQVCFSPHSVSRSRRSIVASSSSSSSLAFVNRISPSSQRRVLAIDLRRFQLNIEAHSRHDHDHDRRRRRSCRCLCHPFARCGLSSLQKCKQMKFFSKLSNTGSVPLCVFVYVCVCVN